ncbi:MAG TPA: DUF481 domain-containing protein [Verrucomicrobiae bacterium]|jgi:putative salt-induced outer membrane protein YdiY
MKHIKRILHLAAATFFAAGTLTAAEPEKQPEWVTSAGLNFTLTSGNTETVLFGADINAAKKGKVNEYLLGAAGSYGENQSVKNNELLRGFGQWNRLFNERLYGFLRGEAFHDGIAGVKYRLTGAGGLGYYLIKSEGTRLSLEGAPGYVYEKLNSGENKFVTIRLAERFEQKLSATARLWQTAEYLPNVESWTRDYVVNAELGVQADISKKLALRSVLSDTYDSTPSVGRKSNDLKLTTGVVYKF